MTHTEQEERAMKISVALATVTATLATAVLAGAVLFAPTAPNIKPNTVFKSDSEGLADIDLPENGLYALHVDTLPIGYEDFRDQDGTTSGLCGRLDLSLNRCINVEVIGTAVYFPGLPDQVVKTWITFSDTSPEPRVRVIVRDYVTKEPTSGGAITVVPVGVSEQKPLAADNHTGTTTTDKIVKGQYTVTFTPKTGFEVLGNGAGPAVLVGVVSALRPFEFIVVASKTAVDLVDPGEKVEIIIGGQEESEKVETEDEEPTVAEQNPMDEAPVEEELFDPEAELRADCFMYLEMYPQLAEADPGLPAYCEVNPSGARGIIRSLFDELGI
jgi:hypothetical protein